MVNADIVKQWLKMGIKKTHSHFTYIKNIKMESEEITKKKVLIRKKRKEFITVLQKSSDWIVVYCFEENYDSNVSS